ncbi:hypothetical protein [Nocardia sp. NBC_01009]|uniref:hypothetical protein n=1 Tax=Nocardia sp. NBC_01009 TaxID=2975996 RepID=UPI00386C6F78|nr:hypothetical protein OHA42_04830 [Nocardia sp. NBC_01009]
MGYRTPRETSTQSNSRGGPRADGPMIAVAAPDVLDRWRQQPCDDTHVENIEHARFALTAHSGHGCTQFDAALRHVSRVLP